MNNNVKFDSEFIFNNGVGHSMVNKDKVQTIN